MILEVTNLVKNYGKKRVLNKINLIIDKPRLIALVAPNGSGKTTLLNIICNLEKPDKGQIKVLDLPNTSIEIFTKVSYMQDNTVLYYDLTGMAHIKFIKDIHQISDERVSEVLERLRLTDYVSKKVKYYSLGMKQNLLFALAILPKPKLLLMDEPLNGLDPASVVMVRNVLLELYQNGTTVLFSSHNLEQIDKLTDDIYFLKDQHLLSYKEKTTCDTVKTYKIITDKPNALAQEAASLKLDCKVVDDYKCTVVCRQQDIDYLQTKKFFTIYEQQEMKNSLEQLYFELYEDYQHDGI